jgi:hypothetical protein
MDDPLGVAGGAGRVGDDRVVLRLGRDDVELPGLAIDSRPKAQLTLFRVAHVDG